jgi:excinuclease ABC subunit C
VKMLRSKLNAIKGIGEKSVELLIHSLKSYENIKNTDVDTLQKLIGKNKTKLLKEYFQGEDMV